MRVGMFATATLRGKVLQTYAQVPEAAVLHLHDRDWVYMLADRGTFRRVAVEGGDMLPGGMQEIRVGTERRPAGRVECACPAVYGGSVMIRGLVDFALNNRWLVLGAAILLFGWGIISFHNLPVEAYPDVANNYVQIITQWPGRAAEEVEQQVTVPTRDPDGRYPAHAASALNLAGRPLQHHAYLR